MRSDGNCYVWSVFGTLLGVTERKRPEGAGQSAPWEGRMPRLFLGCDGVLHQSAAQSLDALEPQGLSVRKP